MVYISVTVEPLQKHHSCGHRKSEIEKHKFNFEPGVKPFSLHWQFS